MPPAGPGCTPAQTDSALGLLELMAEEMAAANGWDSGLLSDTRIGLRIVIGLLDDEATQVNASQVEELKKIDLPVWTVRHVLASAGQLQR